MDTQVERLAMARIFLLIVLLVAAALANEPSNKQQESEFQQEMLKNLNKTNENLDRFMRSVYEQVVVTRKAAEEQNEALIKFSVATNDRLDQMAKTMIDAEKNLNETTNDRFNQLQKQNEQTLEYVKQVGKQQNQKLDALANLTEHHIQIFQTRFPPHCNLARSSKLTLLTNGKKYFFSPTFTNWNSANETCAKMGLHLATIRDQNEALIVATGGKTFYPGNSCWVSAKNQGRGSEKDFRWSDGTKLALNSPLWMDKADKKKDCVLIYHGWNKGKLNGNICTINQPFICELPNECY
ncbi:T-cell surface glycoprotein YE1/48-like isoform X1 [Neocloeon triangulifer]|uniref:T-cell surface glycoprotein YE1/48-like isoform X1 n=1 Tax=Neocloeon triangulifer TaxID=2078957 RepID=UPI00286EDD7F|nr:T-cell surface glycoprotein YE1/48-like isoform X1 [Neocloeon triangulifer]